ncbi:type I restriction endonuclease subunit R [Streptomyces sp. NBC_01428]|uniref:type I restriction endonuclease subunit R n=1 Tax=Streptomyces sp. NBC_01428 TaxID=2903861 RepID=UPI002E31BC0C|nr:HsdR family type I site-specific deoxyribonuclease [Streptomyces sp. NBC_01428]
MSEHGAGTAGPTERELEGHTLELLGEYGWRPVDGAELGPSSGERIDWDDLVLRPRLSEAIGRRYPHLPERSVDDAVAQLLERATGNDLRESHRFHQRLVSGVGVPYSDAAGDAERHTVVRPVDFSDPYANDLLAARQVKVRSAQDRVVVFDIVLYVNGLPLAAVELKRTGGRDGARDAYDRIQGYRRDLKETGTFANVLVTLVSDGTTARMGTPFTAWDHMAPWHADPDGALLRRRERQDGRALERMLLGAFEPARLLDLVANFLSYSARRTGAVDTVTLARAHQFFAVNAAVRATETAVATDGKAGVVRHAQGAGRSQEMLFYVGKAARAPELPHPMFVVLTDRVDLGNRLYATFTASCTLLAAIGGGVEWAQDSTQLRQLLRRHAHSGVVFATVQKFRLTHEERDAGARHPLVSARRDVIVVVDEAHRGQSALHALNLREALPNATFIAFTATLADDRNGRTHAVFGDTIHTYDLAQAVDDGATVPVFYESRPIRTPPEDVDFDLDVGFVPDAADLAASPARTEALARDVLAHWDVRRTEMAKLTGRPGKGMVVTSSRLAAARLFEAFARLRPEWTGGRDPRTGLLSDTGGRVRAAVTGHIGDSAEIADHVRTPEGLRTIQRRIVDPDDELELVIVRSLWLTGFDAPPLHTLYLDQRMRGPALLEAVTLVNRTWDGKPSGLVVDYQGVGSQLAEVLADATRQDGDDGAPVTDVAHAVDAVRDNHRRLLDVLASCPWREIRDGSGPDTYREAVTAVLDHLAAPEPGTRPGTALRGDRFTRHVDLLRGAFSLCPADAGVRDLLVDIRFFEAVWTAREKLAGSADDTGAPADLYAAAGLAGADLSRPDDGLLDRLRASRRPHLAVEALHRTLVRDIRQAHPDNVVRQEALTARTRQAVDRYANGLVTAAEVMASLVALAREVSDDRARAQRLELTEDELAFYDALVVDPLVTDMMGAAVLVRLARELYGQVRSVTTVDWRLKNQARDRVVARVLRLLRRHGYPSDQLQAAVERVLRQAEEQADEWT